MKRFSKRILFLITSLLLIIAMLCGCYSEGNKEFFVTSEDDFSLEIVSDTLSEISSMDEQPKDETSSIEEVESKTEPTASETSSQEAESKPEEKKVIDKNGSYTSPEDVAEYIRTYNKLPKNYIKKKDAEALGWVSSKGNLWKVTDHKSIGGDTFGNREGRLPKKSGRKWYECDVNYKGGYRGEERILYSNDGLIYYTNDHYETFTLME